MEEVMTMDLEEKEDGLEALKNKAQLIANDIIKEALETLRELQKKEAAAAAKYKVNNITWSTCKDFTVGKGLLQIEEYLNTWELHESWLHWTNYLCDEELEYSTRYHYRVRFSIPTCRKPIPRATANVYFIIEISKIKPPTFPVEVFFVVETNKLIHRPGESRFKEKWLKDVIESKIYMMKAIGF
ncbi:A-kinase anchor protein 14 isoform X2 [Hemicordylus capensis]|uniref:A-kinase anchor protein 14 isoform X2 n=1 Tax=Hemicordylus capensis TaxID=884348 RepID=UPI0023030CA6|nr:A-kinase anchor protein 14 isoform X2 [Hemicordylus capensis]